jgi:hypothetical protein
MRDPMTRFQGFKMLLRKGAWSDFFYLEDDPLANEKLARHKRALDALTACPDIDGILDNLVSGLDGADTRAEAISDLIRVAGDQAFQVGSIYISSGDVRRDHLRLDATNALKDRATAEDICSALESSEFHVVFWGVWRFGWTRYGHEGRATWIEMLPRLQRIALVGDEQLRRAALEELTQYSESRAFVDEQIRVERSAYILQPAMSKEKFVERLYLVLFDPDEQMRQKALVILAGNNDKNRAERYRVQLDSRFLDRVIELTQSPSENERFHATSALVGIRALDPEKSRQALLHLARDESAKVRLRVAFGLTDQIDKPEVQQTIDALIHDSAPAVSFNSILAAGAAKYRPELQQLVNCPDPKVAKWAGDKLKQLEEEQLGKLSPQSSP